MMSNRDAPEVSAEKSRTEHLEDVEDGAGCTEIWAHLSERRAQGD
jgi:hypothetical protein